MFVLLAGALSGCGRFATAPSSPSVQLTVTGVVVTSHAQPSLPYESLTAWIHIRNTGQRVIIVPSNTCYYPLEFKRAASNAWEPVTAPPSISACDASYSEVRIAPSARDSLPYWKAVAPSFAVLYPPGAGGAFRTVVNVDGILVPSETFLVP